MLNLCVRHGPLAIALLGLAAMSYCATARYLVKKPVGGGVLFPLVAAIDFAQHQVITPINGVGASCIWLNRTKQLVNIR